MDEDTAREVLLALREEALARLADLGVNRDDVVQASQGANIDDEHDPEGSTIAYERALLEALAVSARARIADTDAALARLAAGDYGICEVCGEPIGAERLAARPVASRCLRHS
ncbi:TraR/DksA family transcriptional regulator [Occultella gossypii]|uniref:TraR/DksA C4-type zinc finger protein n=1 Tax=Occultella gossypii TaxID=2800820 RepID=A0ABS7S6F1_9MICO|nr:TraR/DksA C4-type zinc finger protein [Occultella gossypii]MBZ2195340.1 TraR/DksA C4-type zinc finger protein [Occultella gossypii]